MASFSVFYTVSNIRESERCVFLSTEDIGDVASVMTAVVPLSLSITVLRLKQGGGDIPYRPFFR